MAQQPPIKIKRPRLVFSSWGSGPWLPAAITDVKQTCLMWDVVHAYKKNRTPVDFHRIRETSLFPTNTEQCLGSFLRIKEMTGHALDLNHTNQKHHIFAAVHFWNFWKQYIFPNPVSSQHVIILALQSTNFCLQFALKNLLECFP